MKKPGFVQAVKSRGKYYYYVRRAFREKENIIKKNIFALGQKEKAIETIDKWIENRVDLPEEMKNYSKDDLLHFKRYIEEKE